MTRMRPLLQCALILVLGILVAMPAVAQVTLPPGWQGYKFRPEPYRGTWTSAAMPSNGWMFDIAKDSSGASFVFVAFYTYTVVGDPTFWTMFAPLSYTSDEEYRTTGVMARAEGAAYTVRGGTVWGGAAQSAVSTSLAGGALTIEWTSPRTAVVLQNGTSVTIAQSELSTPNWAGDYVAITRLIVDYPGSSTDTFLSGTPIVRLTAMPANITYTASPFEQPNTDFHMIEPGSQAFTVQCVAACDGTGFRGTTVPYYAPQGELWHIAPSGAGWVTHFRPDNAGHPNVRELYFVEGQGPNTTTLRTAQVFAQRDQIYVRWPQLFGIPWEGYEDALLIRLPPNYLNGQ